MRVLRPILILFSSRFLTKDHFGPCTYMLTHSRYNTHMQYSRMYIYYSAVLYVHTCTYVHTVHNFHLRISPSLHSHESEHFTSMIREH
ncbi:hypothetical protein IE53DRAFT_72609 [Violaceomyces palustris]|uniref:Uncharacterized protein n=1 Tax=Violaceomyces palustris TaxID=1673888 RepID=A0ACD0NYK5_9BASI|nr:hypothetical protein IE53DRAFT_72609 [Violaceomyces palustris]